MPLPVFPDSIDTAVRVAVAALVGLVVGIERVHSGHAIGQGQHFAGTRTFLLIGLLGGLGGFFVFTVHSVDGTTEAAALVVLALVVLPLLPAKLATRSARSRRAARGSSSSVLSSNEQHWL